MPIPLVILIIVAIFGSKNDAPYTKPLSAPIRTLDPTEARTREEFMLTRAIFGQLLQFDEFGGIEQGIIDHWSIEHDGKTYTLHIRDDALFQNGKKVTAQDIEFSIRYFARPESLISSFFSNIKGFKEYTTGESKQISGVEIRDISTVRISLIHNSFTFITMLADPKVQILPHNFFGLTPEEFFLRPIGAGPYMVKEFRHDRELIFLVPFEKYFGYIATAKPMRLITYDRETAIKDFNLGKLDDLETFPLNALEDIGLRRAVRDMKSAGNSSVYLFFNGKNQNLINQVIRQTISDSVDRNDMISECSLSGVPLVGIFPHGIMGWESASDYKLKNKSIRHNKTVLPKSLNEIRILVYGDAIPACVADYVRKVTEKSLQIPTRIERYTFAEALQKFAANEYDILIDDITIRGREPMHFLAYFDPRSPHSIIRVSDPKLSSLIMEIDSSRERSLRASLYRKFSQYVSQEQTYAVPLFSAVSRFIFSDTVFSDRSPNIIYGNTPFNLVGKK
jgi:ABC-type oligopeptide transport system substrate-binding subunit